jgi:hypothetical protein
MNNSYSVHASLPTQTIWVKEDIFYNMEQSTDKWVKAKVFGLTCLTGKVPCFEILTSDGYVFSDIPPHMIRFSQPDETKQYELQDLVYNNCLSEDFCISELDELKSRNAHVFLKDQQTYIKGQYWFSLDFYKNNNWYHCLKLSNGQVAFIPSHKIVFSDNQLPLENHQFPKYKKLRLEFKV